MKRAREGVVASLALSLLAGPAHAQAPRPGVPAKPTLVYLAPSPSGSQALQPEAKEFHRAALGDLAACKSFQLLDPASVPTGGERPTTKTWRAAGAQFLLRIISKPLGRGRVLFESECVNLETGALVLKRVFVGEAEGVHRMAHRLIDFLVGKLTGTPGVADSTIVFARQTSPGIMEIYGMDRDGRSLRQWTSFGSLSTHPALSGDGKLALVTYKGGPPEIWGQLQPMGPFQRFNPATGGPGQSLSDLAWAPDNQNLAFVQAAPKGCTDIYVLNTLSNRTTRLTQGGHANLGPCWSPRGAELAYLSDRTGTAQVFIMASNGSHPRQLTSDSTAKQCVAWSAQGDRIAYGSRSNGTSTLFTLAPDGGDLRQVITTAAAIESLCWAPDGRSLLFGIRSGHTACLRLANLDGTIQDLAPGQGSSEYPQWVRNHLPSPSLTLAEHSAVPPEPAPLGPVPHS